MLTVIDARVRDLGGFSVRRLLPAPLSQMVGPFIFFDHMGPAQLAPGEGLDVRPHPHIGLATVTYLFEGEIVHRDSLGSHQTIRPGDINWMTAGHGIVHSERTGPELRRTGSITHGLQLWVALPQAFEEVSPSFRHHPAATLPEQHADGVQIRLLAGSAYGLSSPVKALSPLFYVHASMAPHSSMSLPDAYEERAAYVIDGAVRVNAERVGAGSMLVFAPGAEATLQAESTTSVALIGGAPLDGPRYVDWNLVSSSQERIAKAKQDWKTGRFPKVPGDEIEFIPLPE
jgi:redox-sensitive bicupin YhaK (pirin superfamily)